MPNYYLHFTFGIMFLYWCVVLHLQYSSAACFSEIISVITQQTFSRVLWSFKVIFGKRQARCNVFLESSSYLCGVRNWTIIQLSENNQIVIFFFLKQYCNCNFFVFSAFLVYTYCLTSSSYDECTYAWNIDFVTSIDVMLGWL